MLDAKDIAAGPIARVRLPEGISSGTHSCWMPLADSRVTAWRPADSAGEPPGYSGVLTGCVRYAALSAALIGILIAVSFGAGDFVGGRAESSSTAAVLLVSQAFSVVGACILAIFVSARVAPHDLVYGALAGSVNVVGLGLLYHGLARYSAGVVAPLTAVVGSLVPVSWGLLHGERPSSIVLAGVLLAVGAGGLIAREPVASAGASVARGAPQAIAAGFALGSSLVLFSETSARSGQFPLLAARISACVVAAVSVWWFKRSRTVHAPQGPARALAVGAGGFDVAATALLVVAVRRELISVVAPVASLAPGFTVILAWRIGHQQLSTTQRLGLAAALAGLVLVSVG